MNIIYEFVYYFFNEFVRLVDLREAGRVVGRKGGMTQGTKENSDAQVQESLPVQDMSVPALRVSAAPSARLLHCITHHTPTTLSGVALTAIVCLPTLLCELACLNSMYECIIHQCDDLHHAAMPVA